MLADAKRLMQVQKHHMIAARFKRNAAVIRNVDAALNPAHLHHIVFLNVGMQFGAICQLGRDTDNAISFAVILDGKKHRAIGRTTD